MRDDPEFNIAFVRLVENFPCIYDHHHEDYHRAHVQNRVWGKIAKEIGHGATVKDCKSRWRNLRGRFTKHLKSTVEGNVLPKRPYYLAEYLDFVVPFTKQRLALEVAAASVTVIASSSPPPKEEEGDQEDNVPEDTYEETQETTGDGQEPYNDATSNNESPTPVNAAPPLCKRKLSDPGHQLNIAAAKGARVCQQPHKFWEPAVSIQDGGDEDEDGQDGHGMLGHHHPAAMQPRLAGTGPLVDINDSDALFMLSVLPDLRRMNETQKRRFKIGILNLSGDILGDKEEAVPGERLPEHQHNGVPELSCHIKTRRTEHSKYSK
ncbi:uncharacterized protein LOC129739324 [Uranotaenia lowii]|uniref:uncharacterized protein LOC129739324 n=1 Tax=Uranotaenia lowii TaxID=190385 RepID=UPI0024785608|nr:uncharacterized protein LOC129739324 [Uranotaenia lowii]